MNPLKILLFLQRTSSKESKTQEWNKGTTNRSLKGGRTCIIKFTLNPIFPPQAAILFPESPSSSSLILSNKSNSLSLLSRYFSKISKNDKKNRMPLMPKMKILLLPLELLQHLPIAARLTQAFKVQLWSHRLSNMWPHNTYPRSRSLSPFKETMSNWTWNGSPLSGLKVLVLDHTCTAKGCLQAQITSIRWMCSSITTIQSIIFPWAGECQIYLMLQAHSLLPTLLQWTRNPILLRPRASRRREIEY